MPTYRESMIAVLKQESAEILKASDSLPPELDETLALILARPGKIVVSGLGKSGHIGSKVASTLSSTGTSAVFLHPSEALHGDFGLFQQGDSLIALAQSGETEETVEVARFARRIGIPIIAITGNLQSRLAQLAHCTLSSAVSKEADPYGLAPTCSSTVALALGDALAVAMMEQRGFGERDFAGLHPGGKLGRRLSLVRDLMKPSSEVGMVQSDDDFHAVLRSVTKNNFGVSAVFDRGDLIGAISDGDVRRTLLAHGADALTMNAEKIMAEKSGTGARTPRVVVPHVLALDALREMSEIGITQLFVTDASDSKKLVGLVRMHDLLMAKIV